MTDDLVKDIIQQPASGNTSPSEKEPPRKRLTPLLLSTVLLSVALVAALLGIFLQHRSSQSDLAAADAAHRQELSRLSADHESQLAALQEQQDALAKETQQANELLEDTQLELELLTLRYQTLFAQSEGVRLAEFIIELYEQGRSDLAAEVLRSMVSSTRQYFLSQSLYTVPNRSGSLDAIFVYSTRIRLLAVAEQLLDQGLITGEEVDYIRNLTEYHHIFEEGALSPTPDQ